MSANNESQSQSKKNNSISEKCTFTPMLYNFRAPPRLGSQKTFALQQPFATLFDNLISVLWAVYSKKPSITIGVNQLQWALEFMRCMKVEYGYPENIGRIVNDLEDKLIALYARVGKIIYEKTQKTEIELNGRESQDKKSSEVNISDNANTSYNEMDIMKKLNSSKVVLDPVTGESKYLNDLNALGRRKPPQDRCAKEIKSSKNYMIGALQKILKKTTDVNTKVGVEELIQELKVNSPKKKMAP